MATIKSKSQDKVNLNLVSNKLKYDTTKIKDVSNKLAIYANTISKIHNINISNPLTSNKLKIQPNGQTNVGLGFNYKWLGIGASFSLPFMNKDDELYGETTRFDTQFNIFSRWFGVDAHIQYYKGFYLENPKDFIDWQEIYYPHLSDIESLSLGISAYYFFNNKRFSYKAAFTRTQIQKKSAGAFILGVFCNLNVSVAPSGYVPIELGSDLMTEFDLTSYSTGILGISFGYTYTLVLFKKFFINASLVPGIGSRIVRIYSDNTEYQIDPVLSGSLTSRFAIGYEGKHLYWGFNAISINDTYENERMEVSSTTGNVRLFIGKRFNFSLKRKKNKE